MVETLQIKEKALSRSDFANMRWTPRPSLPIPFEPLETGDVLAAYLRWFLTNGPSCPMVPANGLVFFGNGPGIVLHRDGQFQTQLFFGLPNTKIPKHRHPNVDSIEVHIGPCDLFFYVEGIPAIPHEFLHHERNGVSRWWGRGVRVRPNQSHHLEVGPGGGAFLSSQHWLNGRRPSSVDLDWDGDPMEAGHAEALFQEQEMIAVETEVAGEPI